ncbi:sulfotransferase family protein [Arenimonas composti]|uniref:Sulfotransferase domain-containing protein n=1 Tax=Arenimonas composti TR7-09 = DSM 18010 TaxID=1121013 RepID=A0A091BDI5_9GAMM|nr:sulfotransferase [Arenimonas composti]KFN48879.1 hypothetical protein P873_13075 [Arenimonas composti TR7-09 = DSM 18010]
MSTNTRNVPDFIGIGAQRCGTTWLDTQLRRHPQLYLPQRRKEVHYFDEYHDRGPAWYREFFPDEEIAGRRAVGEITPKYLFDPACAGRIHAEFPDAKLLVVLRNPTERAYSQYGLHVGRYARGGGFAEFLADQPDAVERGRYAAQLERYFALFPRERVLVMLFEEVMADRVAALDEVCRFLGVDTGLLDGDRVDDQVNASERPRFARARSLATRFGNRLRGRDMDWIINLAKKAGVMKLFGVRKGMPPLPDAERARLDACFADDIARLEILLGRSLDIWRAPSQIDLPGAA